MTKCSIIMHFIWVLTVCQNTCLRVFPEYKRLNLLCMKELINQCKYNNPGILWWCLITLTFKKCFSMRSPRIWNWWTATVWFQYNRKLCYKKINQFIHTIGHENLTKDEDVSKETNGDQMPCMYISLLSTQSVLTEIIHNVQIRKFYGVKL